MNFANEYDIANFWNRFNTPTTPNLAAAVLTLDNLREWADDNSDGWAYWPKPCRAAAKLITALQQAERDDRAHSWDAPEDIERATLTKLYSPIRAFLTRQGSPDADFIIVVPA